MKFGRSACQARERPTDKQGQFGSGDGSTWTALCADTKLISSWKIGTRWGLYGLCMMHDLAARLKNRIPRTTDGHRAYAEAVESASAHRLITRCWLGSAGTTANQKRATAPQSASQNLRRTVKLKGIVVAGMLITLEQDQTKLETFELFRKGVH